ncbi:MAG: hypothetical protein QM680_01035 [Luteolibacter sp.]
MGTRIIQLTASRVFVGQHTIEIPDFCRNERFQGIVARGGSTARFLSNHMAFARVHGTGLAQPFVSTPAGIAMPDFCLADISACLREDGFHF